MALQLDTTGVDKVVQRNVGMKWNSLAERGRDDRDLYARACVRAHARE